MGERVTIWLDAQMDEGPATPRGVLDGELRQLRGRVDLTNVRVDERRVFFVEAGDDESGAWYGYLVVTLSSAAAELLVSAWYHGTHELRSHLGTGPR